MRGYCSRSRKAPIPPTERGNFTEPKAQIDFAPQGANQTQQARYLRITISQKLNVPTHCLQEGHPLNPDSENIKRKETMIMENNKRRDLYLKIRVNQEELDYIDRKFRESGMKSRSDFVRAMIYQGYIVKFSEFELKELIRLARNISSNINQIAVRANSGGKIYDNDIADIKKGVDQLWQPLRYFQSQLMSLHR